MEELNKKIEICQFAMNLKIQCLELADRQAIDRNAESVLETAKKYYAWVDESIEKPE